MNLQDYQEFTRTTAIYPKNEALKYLGLGLTSEAGEVAGKIKKMIRDGGLDTVATIDELGDVLWYVTRLCDELGFTLADVFSKNHIKLSSRKERNVLKGSGDVR